MLKLKLPTDKESAERTRNLAWVYGELEQMVCEARNMTRLAFEKATDAKQSFKNDEERDDANMAMFTLTKAYEAVEKLFKEYYDAFGRPAFEKRRT
jgi:hypothetical protein